MDPRERLRLALIGAGCARCGRPYASDGIRVLAQREEIAFVQLVCFACRTETLALVTGAPGSEPQATTVSATNRDAVDGSAAADSEVAVEDAPPRPEAPPFSRADVSAMHAFLEGYRGDLRHLVGAPDDGAAGR